MVFNVNTEINERFSWASTLLDVTASEHILEIGCGAGLLVEQIASRLRSGKLMAVDKSPAMIKMASKRNAEAVAKRKLIFATGDFADLDFSSSSFDKVAAFSLFKNSISCI